MNLTCSISHTNIQISAQTYLFIRPLPEAAHEEDDGDGGLEVGADGLDVDKKLPALTCLDDRNPQHGHHHQHEHKHPASEALCC